MKYDFLILSSLSRNSGCFLRATYLADSLKKAGARVKLVKPSLSKPLMLDFLLNFFISFFAVIKTDYKTGVAIKPYPNTLLPLLIKRIFTKNRIAVDIDDIDFGYRSGAISLISRWIQKPFPRFFDMVTYHNPLLKDFIQKEYGVSRGRLFVLKQGVDLNLFSPGKGNEKFKTGFLKKHELKKGTRILIYTAHLNIASDLDIILENIRRTLEIEKTFLIIAGGGPMLDHYRELAEKLKINNIFFTGYCTPREIVQYVLLSDLSLVYYKDKKVNYFRSSMKLREHLALRKKIICNNVGELKLFKKFTYQSNKSISSFIRLLDEVLKKFPKDRREDQGYQYIKKHYNWEKIAGEFKKHLMNKF
ncbi:MAG: glycosyltransferase [Spirochaetes bacterium]|nr:glycosyltransferase [Spirochaetota bacterium]